MAGTVGKLYSDHGRVIRANFFAWSLTLVNSLRFLSSLLLCFVFRDVLGWGLLLVFNQAYSTMNARYNSSRSIVTWSSTLRCDDSLVWFTMITPGRDRGIYELSFSNMIFHSHASKGCMGLSNLMERSVCQNIHRSRAGIDLNSQTPILTYSSETFKKRHLRIVQNGSQLLLVQTENSEYAESRTECTRHRARSARIEFHRNGPSMYPNLMAASCSFNR